MLNKDSNIIYQKFINHIYAVKYPYTGIITLNTYLKLEIKDFNNLIIKKY